MTHEQATALRKLLGSEALQQAARLADHIPLDVRDECAHVVVALDRVLRSHAREFREVLEMLDRVPRLAVRDLTGVVRPLPFIDPLAELAALDPGAPFPASADGWDATGTPTP